MLFSSRFLNVSHWRAHLLAISVLAIGNDASAISIPVTHWLGQTSEFWSGKNWAYDAAGTPALEVPGPGSQLTFSALGASRENTTLDLDVTIGSLAVNSIVGINGGTVAHTLTVTGDTLVNDGLLSITAGTIVAGNNNFIASALGTSGAVIVKGTGTQWTAAADLNVGFEGGGTLLRVEEGALVSANYTKIGGYVSSTDNEVVVTGAGSQLSNTHDLIVGYGGNGNSLTVSNGATVTNLNGFVGFRFDPDSSSKNNSVTVTGADSRWTNLGTLYLGDHGTGNSLTLSDGGKVVVNGTNQDAVVGNTAASTGNSLTVSGSGSEFSNNATFYLGKGGGNNTLMVQEGGTMTTKNVRIGGDASSGGNTATVTGADSIWGISGTALRVGSNGSNNALNITAGGVVQVYTGNTFVGYGSTSKDNSLSITGEGSAFFGQDITVGRQGTGNTLTVADGGWLNAYDVILGDQAGSAGALKIGVGGLSGIVNANVVRGGSGTASLEFDHTDDIEFDAFITGTTSVTKNGSGITGLTGLNDYTGTTQVNAGVLAVAGLNLNGGHVTVATGAVLAGSGDLYLADDAVARVNGGILVEEFRSKKLRKPGLDSGALFSISTGGSGALIMGAGSFIALDLFTGAGMGSNLLEFGSSDTLAITGAFDVSAGSTLIVGNPTGMTGFAVGDEWQLLAYCGCVPPTGTLALNDSALALPRGLAGSFDMNSGIYRIVDVSAQVSTETGLQMAGALDQSMVAGIQGMLSDIGGRLFNLRAGSSGQQSSSGTIASAMNDGVVEGEGDGPESPIRRQVPRSQQWEVFTTVNYANISLSTIANQPGVDSYSWAPAVGIEKHLTPNLSLGLAASLMQAHQTYNSGLGEMDVDGVAFSIYGSYVRGPLWADLLYSLGRYDLQADRNPGFAFPMARGETVAWSNAVQFNTGWNFRFMDGSLVTGPFVGVDYLRISVDGYTETGGGAAALSFADREVDSLITRVGWSVSKRLDTDFATITPQLSLSYERQNISNNNGTSVSLINLPFTATSSGQAPGQDYLVAGAGVNFQFRNDLSLMLSYSGQFLRQDMQAHFVGLRVGWAF